MKTTKKLTALLLSLVLTASLCVPAFAAGAFTDLPESHWAYADVMECAKLGVVAGFEDGSFLPDNNVTAIQFLVMLTRTFYPNEIAAVTDTTGQPWYYAYTKVAADVGLSTGLTAAEINDTIGMTRYNMAQALYNTLKANNNSTINQTDLTNAQTTIKDWNSIPLKNQVGVTACYAKGILTGMSDGTFAGTQSMTRAQACAVIVRMMKLINNATPGDADNDTYDNGTSQNTLANGDPITTGNVAKILQEIRAKYPHGTTWGPGTYYGIPGEDIVNLNKQFKGSTTHAYGTTSMSTACGGFAAMVSETIFGKTGYPFRQVTNAKDVRPGDVIVTLNSDGELTHYSVASSGAVQQSNGVWVFTTVGGNVNGKVKWATTPGTLTTQFLAYTRYPD